MAEWVVECKSYSFRFSVSWRLDGASGKIYNIYENLSEYAVCRLIWFSETVKKLMNTVSNPVTPMFNFMRFGATRPRHADGSIEFLGVE